MSIESILARLAAARPDRRLQPPASAAQLDELARALREAYDAELPGVLRELYAIADGISHDGFQLFATKRAPFATAPTLVAALDVRLAPSRIEPPPSGMIPPRPWRLASRGAPDLGAA